MNGAGTTHARLQDAETVAKVLAKARDSVTDIAGAVVATRDGLVMAANIDPELEAAARAASRMNTRVVSGPQTVARIMRRASPAATTSISTEPDGTRSKRT